MFGIEWLRRGVRIEKATSVLTSEPEAIAAAESRGAFCGQTPPRARTRQLSFDGCDRQNSRGFPNSPSIGPIQDYHIPSRALRIAGLSGFLTLSQVPSTASPVRAAFTAADCPL